MNFLNKLRGLVIASTLCLAALSFAETYALMIGINDYPEPTDSRGQPLRDANGNLVSEDLFGCVKDVTEMSEILKTGFKVKSENIRLITNAQANENGFVEGMRWLLRSAKPGDQVVFMYSGHGAQIADTTEADGKQEVLVLADHKLVPDKFFQELSNLWVKSGIRATLIFDSCHSGGMDRMPADVIAKQKFTARLPKSAAPVAAQRLTQLQGAVAKPRQAQAPGSFAFLFAGQESQTTSDLRFKDDSPAHGAFTLIMLAILKDIPTAPAQEMVDVVKDVLEKNKFAQVPNAVFSSPERAKEPILLMN